MAQNPTIVRLTGGGTWTVPAGVKQVWIYSEFNGSNSIAASANNSYIRSQSGRVYSFGDDAYGQLGNGVTPFADVSTPYAVVAGRSFVQVAGSILGLFALGLEADGSVYAWGENTSGQLGDNTVVLKSTPVLVVGNHSFIQVAAGGAHSLALKADGSVYAWGYNANGRLGNNDPTLSSKSSPVPVSGSHAFIQVAAGGNHSLALKADGSVYTWGYNSNGQLGDNTIVAKSSPVLVFSTNTTVPISDLSSSTMRRIYDVTPGNSISYKTGKSPNYFGEFTLASDITELVLEYYI